MLRALHRLAAPRLALHHLPAGSLSCHTACRPSVGILGAPFNKGQRRDGVLKGPQVIRETGVVNDLRNLGVQLKDYGDVEGPGEVSGVSTGPAGERHHEIVLEYNRRLAAAVGRVLGEADVCVTLGGDHSIAIGTINGHAQAQAQAQPDRQVVVLWVDAHADINTGSSSGTGNMHGMPASHHLRPLIAGVNRLPDGWPAPCMDPHHLVYIGLREVDSAERAYLEKLGIVAFGMREVDRFGLMHVVEHSLALLRPSHARPLHVSFDIDSLDPTEAPSTGTPVRGGLSLREGLTICEAVHATGHLAALDLVEVNPDLGSKQDAARTSQAARLVLLAALAGHRGL